MPYFVENGTKRTCSQDWKVKPQQRLAKQIMEEVMSEGFKETSNMFKAGDVISGLGVVDTNHCGLPWPIYLDGLASGELCGVVQIAGTRVFCDAKTGAAMTHDELVNRRDNSVYDYENKARDWAQRNTQGSYP